MSHEFANCAAIQCAALQLLKSEEKAMKIKNALAGAAIATLAAVGSLAPAQAAVAEAQVGLAIAKIGSQHGWWGPYNSTATTFLSAAGAAFGASAAVSGAKAGAVAGAAGGPVGILIGAATGAL